MPALGVYRMELGMLGLYIHIPFCTSKCKYCAFYSFSASEEKKDEYLTALLNCLNGWSKKVNDDIDSIYIGGGTPSCFGGERLFKLLQRARECFNVTDDCEITVECNPSSTDESLVSFLKKAGVNRISMGMQSAVEGERKAIGRRSSCEQIENAIALFKSNKITNISLDLILGLPLQTMESLDESLDFVLKSSCCHVSAYMLSLEEGTPLFNERESLPFPNEDAVCDMYLHTVKRLAEGGFKQYEISSFSKVGFQSRHNKKYWNCEEYLGIGPSAHSFLGTKRFYYERDINEFLNGGEPTFDCTGGDWEEFILLKLRLSEGLSNSEFKKSFKRDLPKAFFEKAREFEKAGLITLDGERVALTEKGFLVSNSIIAELVLKAEF